MLTLVAARPDKAIQTQLKVDTREAFQEYSNATESTTDITFNLKDFRHMLALAEGLGANIALLFDRPGHPLIVEPRPRRLDPQVGALLRHNKALNPSTSPLIDRHAHRSMSEAMSKRMMRLTKC